MVRVRRRWLLVGVMAWSLTLGLTHPGRALEPEADRLAEGLVDQRELSAEALIPLVLARNPSLAQMTAAWRAAMERYPQVTALDDPMFGATVAPASIGSRDVEFGYRVEISQKYPYPGKRWLRGQAAQAEASAAGQDIADMRLQLIESTRQALAEYYLVDRALAVNSESGRLLQEFRDNARSRLKASLTGQVPEQDVLQAEVEIGRQKDRSLMLERMQRVARARLNLLLHRSPEAALPPPVRRVEIAEDLPKIADLQAQALARRPDLQALADRIRADQAAIALARKEFCPDVEATAAYDTIMGNGPMRDLAAQIGLRVNLPVRTGRRCAALAEAEARLAQHQAELARLSDQVQFQVQEAFELVVEGSKVVRLYHDTVLPAAEANVKAAQTAYLAAKTPFLSLIEAQRNLVSLRDRYYEVIAEYLRRRATLERVTASSPN